ncbi:MAG: hypothetical protein DRJ52_07960 [Thermoprotei archaeon]|nr:MAG: hypothetical protein DRJ52_07960 [Thermoprotei archaeon]
MSLWSKILAKGARLELISIEKLARSSLNVRRDYGDLESLKESIRRKGLLQPLIVRKTNDKYEVIVGERRRKALSELAKEDPRFSKVPCLVVDIDDREAATLSLVENIHRKSISPEEQADGIKLLKEKFGMTEEQIAEEIAVAAEEVKRLVDIYLAVKELGLEVEKKAGRWRQKIVEEAVEKKALKVTPVAVAESEQKPASVKGKPELDMELERLKRKVPFSTAVIVSAVCDWLVRKGVIKDEARKAVFKYLLKVVSDNALRQYEVRDLCKNIRQKVENLEDVYRVVDSFLEDRYSKVEIRVEVSKSMYSRLMEESKRSKKSISEIVEIALKKYLEEGYGST